MPSTRHRVVIVGSGFGGLFAAKALRRAPVEVTLVAATASHLFQPLLYQVATGILSTGEVAPSTREILKNQRNARVVLGTVERIDLTSRTVESSALGQTLTLEYDSLIVAAGAGQSYFGNDHFAAYAPGMKSIDDALEIRGRIFTAFELAEIAEDEQTRQRLTTFVVVGAGPTGVEMAGQIAEMAHRTLRGEFRELRPEQARVVLLDAADAVLGTFGDRLSEVAKKAVEGLGVEVRLAATVVDVDEDGVVVQLRDGQRERIEAAVKIWAAGVQASPLGEQLAEQSGAGLDRAGRVMVKPDLTLPGHPEVFVVGDMMAFERLPGVAQVAIQGGRYAAEMIRARLDGDPAPTRFRYRDKGSMATIARFSAIASVGRLRLSGFVAWLAWLFLHLLYITGFKSRVTTLVHWFASFVGRGRAQRATTETATVGRLAIQRLGGDFHPTLTGDGSPLPGDGRVVPPKSDTTSSDGSAAPEAGGS